VWFQPFAFGDGVRPALIDGAVLSMFTSATVNEAELPATSVTVKVCDWPAPSVEKINDPVCVAPESNPEPASCAVKPASTSVLFQALPFAGVRLLLVNSGAVLSIFTVTLCSTSLLPALSFANQATVLMPSLVIGIETELPNEWKVLPLTE